MPAASAFLEGRVPPLGPPRTGRADPRVAASRRITWPDTLKVKMTRFLNSLPFLKFATNEAIQRTEAYEYAQSLGAQSGPLPNFQVSLRPRGTADRRPGLWAHVRLGDLVLKTFQLYSA